MVYLKSKRANTKSIFNLKNVKLPFSSKEPSVTQLKDNDHNKQLLYDFYLFIFAAFFYCFFFQAPSRVPSEFYTRTVLYVILYTKGQLQWHWPTCTIGEISLNVINPGGKYPRVCLYKGLLPDGSLTPLVKKKSPAS